MTDHPILLFVFCLANLVSAAGFGVIAFTILPRSALTGTVKAAAVLFSLSSGLVHLSLALNTLFNGDLRLADAPASIPILVIHTVLAASLWVFLGGIFIAIGRLKAPSRYDQIDQIDRKDQ